MNTGLAFDIAVIGFTFAFVTLGVQALISAYVLWLNRYPQEPELND